MSDLHDLVATRPGELGTMAAGWLSQGARAVELWGPEGLAARWAPDLELGDHDRRGRRASGRAAPRGPVRFPRSGGAHVPIVETDRELGWVRLVGLSGSNIRRRLLADAAMIASWVNHERDLAVLTDALVARQDELLGMVELLQAARVDDDTDLRRTLAERARQVLNVAALAIATPAEEGWRSAASPRAAAQDIEDALSVDAPPAQIGAALGEDWLVLTASPDEADSLLLIVCPRPDQVVSSPMLRLTRATAELCATLVGQARRHVEALERQRLTRQLEFAGEVQRHLLQQANPRPRGLRVATCYEPAGAVGGDLYVVLRFGDETLLALGDVSGKGAPAALLMAEAKALIESHARRTTEPAELLARVSADLTADLERSHAFLTLVVARFDAATQALSVSNAGHAPVLLKSHDAVRLLEPQDPPIGVMEGARFAQTEHVLAATDTLLIASDGISEREDRNGRRFGIERLTEIMRESETQPRHLLARVRSAADRFAGGRAQGDDVTLVAVQAKPAALA